MSKNIQNSLTSFVDDPLCVTVFDNFKILGHLFLQHYFDDFKYDLIANVIIFVWICSKSLNIEVFEGKTNHRMLRVANRLLDNVVV